MQVDSYEFAEPKDIIPELKKDFWDGLASAKWSERKVCVCPSSMPWQPVTPHCAVMLGLGNVHQQAAEMDAIILRFDGHQQQ